MDTTSVEMAVNIAVYGMALIACIMVLPGVAFVGGFCYGFVHGLVVTGRACRRIRAQLPPAGRCS